MIYRQVAYTIFSFEVNTTFFLDKKVLLRAPVAPLKMLACCSINYHKNKNVQRVGVKALI